MATKIPQNQAPFTLQEILQVTGGVLRGPPRELSAKGVATDTRSLQSGNVFLALRGETFDGHEFLRLAEEKGASCAIVSGEAEVPPSMTAVVVDDTRCALGALAAFHRARWGKRPGSVLLAITGSAGKTTTKTILEYVLREHVPLGVHATCGNLNNAIGVPMTLLGLSHEHRYGVVEMGTNRRGEIAALARIARPDVALLTLIASAHAEGIGSLSDIAEEKGALLASLSTDGIAVGNGDDGNVVLQMNRAPARRRVTYGFSPSCDYRIEGRQARGVTGDRLTIRRTPRVPGADGGAFPPADSGSKAAESRDALPEGELSFDTPFFGASSALAVCAAVATIDALGVALEPARIERALRSAGPSLEGRLELRTHADGTLLLDDSYNANPASMLSSLQAASELSVREGRRLSLVLGEMRELGLLAVEEHERVARFVVEIGAAFVLTIGPLAKPISDAARRAGSTAVHAEDAAHAALHVVQHVRPGDVILVKGSRGVHCERVVETLHLRALSAGAGS